MVSNHLERSDLAEAARLDQDAVRFHPEDIEQALEGSGTDHLGAKAVSLLLLLLLRLVRTCTAVGSFVSRPSFNAELLFFSCFVAMVYTVVSFRAFRLCPTTFLEQFAPPKGFWRTRVSVASRWRRMYVNQQGWGAVIATSKRREVFVALVACGSVLPAE